MRAGMRSSKTQDLPRKLSANDNRFAQLLFEGQTQTAAFLVIRPHAARWQPKSVWQAASKLAAKVQPRLRELQALAVSPTIATIIERKEKLSTIVRKALPRDVTVQAIIAASDQLNRMENLYVQQVEGRHEVTIRVVYEDKPRIVDGSVVKDGSG